MAQAARDQNRVTTLLGVSSDDGITPVALYADPTTHRLLTSASGAAPTDATYVTLSTNATLTSERVLTGTANQITITDNGAGSTVVLSTPQNIATASTPTFAGLTLTAFSGAVSASAGVLSAGTLAVANGGTGVTASTGSVEVVLSNSPTLVTPVLGAATATSINGLTITSSTGTFTLTNAKTLSVTNSLTLSGTDSTVMTFPSTSATIARTDAGQTFTGVQVMTTPTITTSLTTGSSSFDLINTNATTVNFAGAATTMAIGASTALVTVAGNIISTNNAITASGNAATVPITRRVNTVTNNSAATLTITMTTTSAVDGQLSMVRVLDFSAAAQTITWVNTEDSTVTAPTTSNGSTTLPVTVGFQYNSATSKWRCIAKA